MAPSVLAYRILHRLIFADAALGQLKPERQHLRKTVGRSLNHGGDILLAQAVGLYAVLSQIRLHLHDRVGILQPGLFLHSGGQIRLGELVDSQCLRHHFPVNHDTSVIDLLVETVFFPDGIRDGIAAEPLLNLHLHLHVTLIIFFEQRPLLRCVLRQIPVTSRRETGGAEVADQVLALFQLLFLKAENGADLFQSQRETVVCRQYQGASPRGRAQVIPLRATVFGIVPAQPDRQTDPLKAGVTLSTILSASCVCA